MPFFGRFWAIYLFSVHYLFKTSNFTELSCLPRSTRLVSRVFPTVQRRYSDRRNRTSAVLLGRPSEIRFPTDAFGGPRIWDKMNQGIPRGTRLLSRVFPIRGTEAPL